MRRPKKNYNRGRKKPKQQKTQIKENPKFRNFAYIRRSKASEEALRKQKELEAKFAQEYANKDVSTSESEPDEEDAFQNLLSAFPQARQGDEYKSQKRRSAIESSDDDDDDDDDDADIEEDPQDYMEGEMDHQGNELEEIASDEEMSDESEVDSNDNLDDLEECEVGEELSDCEEIEEEDDINDTEMENENDDVEDNNSNDNIQDLEDDESLSSMSDNEKEEDSARSVPQTECELSNMDPFNLHYFSEIQEEAIECIRDQKSIKKSTLTWNSLGCIQFEAPSWKSLIDKYNFNRKKTLLSSDDTVYTIEGTEPIRIDHKNMDLSKHFVVSKLVPNVHVANMAYSTEISNTKPLTQYQTELFSIMRNYQDFYFSQRVLGKAEQIRMVYCLHTLNHALKCRSKVVRNNAKLAAAKESEVVSIISDKYKDQGLVRPRILILVPFRDSVYRIVNNFIALLYGEKQDKAKEDGSVINYKRFTEEFTGDSIRFPKHNPKPDDYETIFSGNTDDTFRIGISLTKKCIKLYTEFYASDILIASPLGLRMIIGAEGDADRDYDFLSSLEILILDQAELFFAQNWDHLLHVFNHVHLQPKSAERTDFSRVRKWCLNGYTKFYRQTLLFTSHELPEFRSLYNKHFSNYSGKLRVCNQMVKGTISQVSLLIPQIFHKIEVSTLQSSFDTRFNYFIKEILPQYKTTSMAHSLIYIPSYFDYVRLRNYFKAESISFVQINEYTKDKKIARARDMFYHSSAHFLLYSERAHFFRRTRIKGIRHLIMYGPPYWPQFYSEMINLMQEGNQNPRDGLENSMTITVLYTKYDILAMSSIVGTSKAAQMLQSNKRTHLITTQQVL